MAWDLAKDPATGDLTGGIVVGQDEIIQRVMTRLWRHLGEWFVNTECGLPWYSGAPSINPKESTITSGILGTRNFRYADNWIRNEIAETKGVKQVLDFKTVFNPSTRIYSIRAQIITDYGLSHLVALDTDILFRGSIPDSRMG